MRLLKVVDYELYFYSRTAEDFNVKIYMHRGTKLFINLFEVLPTYTCHTANREMPAKWYRNYVTDPNIKCCPFLHYNRDCKTPYNAYRCRLFSKHLHVYVTYGGIEVWPGDSAVHEVAGVAAPAITAWLGHVARLPECRQLQEDLLLHGEAVESFQKTYAHVITTNIVNRAKIAGLVKEKQLFENSKDDVDNKSTDEVEPDTDEEFVKWQCAFCNAWNVTEVQDDKRCYFCKSEFLGC